jgi:hypothetical protein
MQALHRDGRSRTGQNTTNNGLLTAISCYVNLRNPLFASLLRNIDDKQTKALNKSITIIPFRNQPGRGTARAALYTPCPESASTAPMARMRGREPMADHLRAGLLLGSTVSSVIASYRIDHFLPMCMGLSDERKFEHLFCAFRRHDKRFRLPTGPMKSCALLFCRSFTISF